MHTQIPVVFFTQSGVPGEVTDVLASSCGPVAVCTQAMEHIGQLSCSPLCCGHFFALQHYTGRFLLHPIMHICVRFSMTQACFCMQVCTSFLRLSLIWAYHVLKCASSRAYWQRQAKLCIDFVMQQQAQELVKGCAAMVGCVSFQR